MTKELLQQALDALIESRDDVAACLADRQRLAGIPRYDKQIAFYEAQLVKHDAAIEGLKQALAQQEPPNPWAEAVIEQLVIHHIYRKEHDSDPMKAVHDLLCISNAMVLDPLVSKPAQDLVDRGRKEAQQEQYPLPDSLYPGSKDWMAGSYKERVEWLHLMYESAKQEVARLEVQQEQPALSNGSVVFYRCKGCDHAYEDTPPSSCDCGSSAFKRHAYLLAPPTQPAQKPYAYEYGKDNGDGTYSVVIDTGSMREVSKNCWESGFPPKDPHKDHSVKPLYTRPAPPTQPALSDEQILEIWSKTYVQRRTSGLEFAREVIEAHCRGEKS